MKNPGGRQAPTGLSCKRAGSQERLPPKKGFLGGPENRFAITTQGVHGWWTGTGHPAPDTDSRSTPTPGETPLPPLGEVQTISNNLHFPHGAVNQQQPTSA